MKYHNETVSIQLINANKTLINKNKKLACVILK